MARLEITSPSGKVREAPLPKAEALTIGRHASCDIRINAEGVEPVHCRFLPDGVGYRVAAGFDDGVVVNGSAVAEKRLSEGDVLKVGPAKLTFRADVPAADGGDGSMELAALSDDARPTWAEPAKEEPKAKPNAKATPKKPAPAPKAKPKPAGAADENAVSPAAAAAIFEEADEEEEDDGAGLGALAALAAEETGKEIDLDAEPDDAADDDGPPPPADGPDSGEQPVLLPAGGRFAPLTKLAGPPRRPGEQSIFKSPLVIGLATTAAVLTLAAFAIALLTSREQAQRLYATAADARAAGQYTVALDRYGQFLAEYPADALTAQVRTERGLTRIEQNVKGSGGKWAEGVTAIEQFVRENRDLDSFRDSAGELAALARQTALGAAREARNGGPRALLETIEQAATLHRRYADPEVAATADQTRELTSALKAATAAVVKRETFGEARDRVAAALEEQDFAAAHRAREDLVQRYADLADDRDVRRLKADTLAAEADAVTPIPAADAPPPPPAPRPAALVPAFASRAGSGERGDGRTILTRAGPSVFAVDAVTAVPAWRASLGAGGAAPFPPVRGDASGSSVLLCDAVRPALASVDLKSGAVNWRLPLPAPATGPPRFAGGAALIGCADGSLLAVDTGNGRVTGGLKFPQPVVSPPVPIGRDGGTGGGGNGGRLLLAADRNTVHTLVGNPPALEAVSYTGHGAGAIAVPPQPMGRFVLLCDVDRADSSVLRAFAVDGESGEASQVGAVRVAGRIDVPPVLRSKELFVSTSPERMTVYAVTDELGAGEKAFDRLAAAQLPDPRPIPTYLAAGPDGLVWAAGSALRLLQLGGDGLSLTPAVLAPGRHVEPPQTSGDRLFTTRLTPDGQATVFAAAEAEAMVGLSRTVLAPRFLAVSGGERPAVLSATGVLSPLGEGFPGGGAGSPGESGGGADGGGATRFLTDGRVLPTLDGDGTDPVLARRLPDGGLVAAVGGAEPRLWEIDGDGRAGRPLDLPAAPQLAPLPLGPGWLVATAGRLELVAGRDGRGVSPFTAPVSEGDPPAWTAAVRLSENRAAVTDAAGAVRLIEYRATPAPNLAEAAVATPDWFADLPPVAAGGDLLVAGSDGRLHRLSGSTLGETAAADLPARAAFAPAVIGGRVLVSLQNRTVAGFAAADLTGETSTPLPAPAAGPPGAVSPEGEVAAAVATTDGSAVRFDPVSGTVTGAAAVGQPLAGPVFPLFGEPAAATADGAIIRLPFDAAGEEVALGETR